MNSFRCDQLRKEAAKLAGTSPLALARRCKEPAFIEKVQHVASGELDAAMRFPTSRSDWLEMRRLP